MSNTWLAFKILAKTLCATSPRVASTLFTLAWPCRSVTRSPDPNGPGKLTMFPMRSNGFDEDSVKDWLESREVRARLLREFWSLVWSPIESWRGFEDCEKS